ncbi:ChbG/HpnK family deacetylase [Actibacterium pelagium]|uniref:Carbohydrate deacetylase n=1 Tax=Actibacterium pelagium TaxID=2029103 RepID=A0A917EID2_9RHOB|nr:ChbG/HpnK family deacetylase [Actibacterium pelagium]GGE44512.1 carbohydrate deacetylase [Actibacterium pelagium]
MKLLTHLDDVGMSAGSVEAWSTLSKVGVVKSASTMVPCPYYLMARDHWQDNPDQDMGVHITLTSEWSNYRWRPMTGQLGGLVDEEGFFHRRPEQVLESADPLAVADEMAAQVERVISDGLRPTHLDAHMGAALLEPFVWSLFDLGKKFGIPVLTCKTLDPLVNSVRVPDFDPGFLSELKQEAEHLGWPVFDNFIIGFCPDDQPIELHVKQLIETASVGLLYYALHADTAQGMDLFAPHHSKPRRKEFEFFSNPESQQVIDQLDIELVSWTELA